MQAPNNRRSLWKSRWLSLFLIAADAIGFSCCWKGAYLVREWLNPWLGPINSLEPYLKVHALIVMVGLLNCAAFGLYAHRRRLSSLNRPSLLIKAGYHWLLYIVVVAYFFKELDLGRSVILMAAAAGFLYLAASRTILRALKASALRHGRGAVRCAIVGAGGLALEVRSFLRNHPEVGYTLAGMIIHPSEDPIEDLQTHGITILGTTGDLNEIIGREDLEEVFLAVGTLDPADQMALMNQAEARGTKVHVISNIFDVLADREKAPEIGAYPIVTLEDGHLRLHQAILKAGLDLVGGVVGTLIWLVFFHWWIALAIKRDSPGPILFSQIRVGRDGREFRIWKYRTMRTDADPYAVAPTSDEDPRVTRFGRWLRKTSLDEFPQFINVLRGEMSLVGPRPEMPFLAAQYQPWERRRLDVKPGMTGLWQVIGRKNLPLSLNMQYDLYYIKNQSFLLDVEILCRTIPAVLKGKGAF